MTHADLINEVVAQAGDSGATYRAQVIRWYNLVRSHIADQGRWRTAFDPDTTITTSSATTDGIYSLTGYETVSGDFMYDETNEAVLRYSPFSSLNATDPNKDTTGNPEFWSDAGVDSSGNRQVYFWPIPDGTFTIRYAAYKLLTAIESTDETDTVDDYFGPIAPWAACFQAGLRYHMALDDNEDAMSIQSAWAAFNRLIAARRATNSVSPQGSFSLANVRSMGSPVYGRLDPSHYNNRQ